MIDALYGPDRGAAAAARGELFHAYIRGDRSVGETLLMQVIHDAMAAGDVAADELRWYSMTLGEWVESSATGCFPGLTAAESAARVRLLLTADLYAYHPSPALYKALLRSRLTPITQS